MKTLPEIEAEQRAIWRQIGWSAAFFVEAIICFEFALRAARQLLPYWIGVPCLIMGAILAARVIAISREVQRRNDAVKEALREIEARQRMEGTK